MSLSKADIINHLYSNCGCSKNKSTELMDGILSTMKSTLESGEDLLISGFGKFCVKQKVNRRDGNPAIGNDLMLGARRIVIFRCSPVLKERLNGKG